MVHQVFLILATTQISIEVVQSWYGHRGDVVIIPPCRKRVEVMLEQTLGQPDDDRVIIFHLDSSESLRNWSWFLEILRSRNYAPTVFRV